MRVALPERAGVASTRGGVGRLLLSAVSKALVASAQAAELSGYWATRAEPCANSQTPKPPPMRRPSAYCVPIRMMLAQFDGTCRPQNRQSAALCWMSSAQYEQGLVAPAPGWVTREVWSPGCGSHAALLFAGPASCVPADDSGSEGQDIADHHQHLPGIPQPQ